VARKLLGDEVGRHEDPASIEPVVTTKARPNFSPIALDSGTRCRTERVRMAARDR
jgi:hypothetical protein